VNWSHRHSRGGVSITRTNEGVFIPLYEFLKGDLTYNSLDAIIEAAYAVPNLLKAAPVQNNPALKKYGDVRPLFKIKDPNLSTPKERANWMNSVW